jgi:hypothetical protein
VTRDIVIWCLRNPERLKTWAKNAKAQSKAEQKQHYAKKHQKNNNNGKTAGNRLQVPEQQQPLGWYQLLEKTSPSPAAHLDFSDEEDFECDNSSETLRWSDIAEDCGWPHPDTGYDPWSD